MSYKHGDNVWFVVQHYDYPLVIRGVVETVDKDSGFTCVIAGEAGYGKYYGNTDLFFKTKREAFVQQLHELLVMQAKLLKKLEQVQKELEHD